MEISWTDRVKDEEVLPKVKDRNVLHTIKIREDDWIGHILRGNWLLNHVTEGEMERRIKVA
jgi:hypothetical protein